jgi:hypothetical protein
MRYQILKPPSPIDIRKHTFATTEQLQILAPPYHELDLTSEDEAVSAARALYPDLPAMPVAVKIGSSQLWIMGFIDDGRELDPDPTSPFHPAEAQHLPFVLFVRAMPDTDRDHWRIQRYQAFEQKKWRPPIQRPVIMGTSVHPVEVRSSDWPGPAHVSAVVGRTSDGSAVIAFDVGGVPMSIRFERGESITVEEKSDPKRTVGREQPLGCTSFDPVPR